MTGDPPKSLLKAGMTMKDSGSLSYLHFSPGSLNLPRSQQGSERCAPTPSRKRTVGCSWQVISTFCPITSGDGHVCP